MRVDIFAQSNQKRVTLWAFGSEFVLERSIGCVSACPSGHPEPCHSDQRAAFIIGNAIKKRVEIPVQADGVIVSLTLRKKIKAGSDVLISYKDSKHDKKKGVIEDLAGNDVESFLGCRAAHIDNHSLGSEGKLRLKAEDVVFQYDPMDGNPGELLFGQSRVENVHKAEENHVSKTSSSCNNLTSLP